MTRKKLFALFCVMALLCGCTTHYGDDKTREVLPSPVLAAEDVTITTYDVDVTDGYFWLLCAADKFYYTAGVQELMDNASKPVPVYAFDPDTGVSEEVAIPYGDTAHLYSMTPAGDGGFWMAFTPLTSGSVFGPAYLVKTDSDFQELFTIDLTDYALEQVSIMGVGCPKSSEYAQEAMEELGYDDMPKQNFFKAEILCDDVGRVYVTSTHEDVVVFDRDGTYLGQFQTFDMEYSQGIFLTKSGSGHIVEGRVDGDLETMLIELNAENFTQSEPMTPDPSESRIDHRRAPMASLLPEYDLFAGSFYGLHGIKFGENGTYTSEPLLYYNQSGLPEDMQAYPTGAGRLVFYWSQLQEDGTKDFNFYVLSMKAGDP